MKTWAEQINPHRGASHTLRFLDLHRLRCSCGTVLVVHEPTAAPAALHAPDRCPAHPGQRAGVCGPCRAEQLERLAERNPFQPVADVTAGAAAARAALAEVAARRRNEGTPTEETG